MSSVPFDGLLETIAAQIAHAGAQPWAELTDNNTLTAPSQVLAPSKVKLEFGLIAHFEESSMHVDFAKDVDANLFVEVVFETTQPPEWLERDRQLKLQERFGV